MNAPIDELITKWEREYVRTLNALKASPNADSDYWRWSGMASRLRDCLVEVHELLGQPAPAYRSKEWRAANGVTA